MLHTTFNKYWEKVLTNLMKLVNEAEENCSKSNFEGINEGLLFFVLPMNLAILNILRVVYMK